jgi:flagella basal body P-ring formation protein FlgA
MDFYIGLLGATVSISSFVGILWVVGGSITLGSGEYAFTVPGYMAVAGVIHASILMALMFLSGRQMPARMAARNDAEAHFRLSLMRVRENADSVAATHGESGERAILEWPGRPMRREDAIEAVRDALVAGGADPDCVVEMAGFTAPVVPVGSHPRPAVAQMDFNANTGRFTAMLSVTAEGMDPITTRIAGQVDTLVEIPVPAIRLASGAVVRAEDLRMTRVSLSQAKGEVVRDPSQAVGMQLKRSVTPNQPISTTDLIRPAVVGRDSIVRIVLDSQGLSLSGQGIALEAGTMGERIRIRNPSSRAVLEAQVIAPGQSLQALLGGGWRPTQAEAEGIVKQLLEARRTSRTSLIVSCSLMPCTMMRMPCVCSVLSPTTA